MLMLTPQDWRSLLHCVRDEHEGFKLCRTGTGDFVTDTRLPPVWSSVLAQVR